MVTRKHELAPKTLRVLAAGGPAGSFVGSSCYNWAILQKSQRAELAEDLIPPGRGRQAEYMQVSVGQAGPVYRSRVDNPYRKSDRNFDTMVQNISDAVRLWSPAAWR